MKVKMSKIGSTQKQEEESSHPARAIKQTSPTKGKSPFQDGLLPGCAPLINKVATSPPRHVARSYNRSRCCPTSIRPRELVLSTPTPSVAPSLPPQPEFHFHKLATSSACSHGPPSSLQVHFVTVSAAFSLSHQFRTTGCLV